MQNKYSDVGLVITSALLGGLLTAFFYLKLNFSADQDVADSYIQSIGTIIAGLSALTAGAFVWWTKQAEIKEERRKEEDFRASFRVKVAADFFSIKLMAGVLRTQLLCENKKIKNLVTSGVLRQFPLFSKMNDDYIKNLNSNLLRKISILEAALEAANAALNALIYKSDLNSEYIFNINQDGMNFLPDLLKKISLEAYEIIELASPELIQNLEIKKD